MLRESKLTMTIVCCVLTSMLCARAASAREIFFDDFNDRNAADGTPVTWAPDSGTWDASSGDYVATGSLPARISVVPAEVLRDTSARAQVRVTGNIAAGIGLRGQPFFGYSGVIRPNGTMTIVRVDGGTPSALANAVVPFNPKSEDVLLQFDAIGYKLSLWAWPVGQSMPSEPQIVAFDTTYAQGPVGLVSAASSAAESDSTTFRFVQVANTHIPEPSTFALMSLAGCGLLYSRWRKRS